MTRTKVYDYDVTEYLDSDEMIAAYLSAASEEPAYAFFLRCLDDVIRAKGMTRIANDTGLGRESLYKAFKSGAKPRYDTVVKVAEALNLKIHFVPAS